MGIALLDWDRLFRWLAQNWRARKYSRWEFTRAILTSAQWLEDRVSVTFEYFSSGEKHYGTVESVSNLKTTGLDYIRAGFNITPTDPYWIEAIPSGTELVIRFDPEDPLHYLVLNHDNPDWPWEIAE